MDTLLNNFDISPVNGFLPNEPVPKLGAPFERWENLAANLATENKNHTIRTTVDSMNPFPFDQLTTSQEFRRAYTILTMIMHSYIFNQKPPVNIIPKQISIPLWNVSKTLGIKPILTHAAVDLFNWYLVDPSKPITLDNLRSTTLITGTEDEERFYLVMVTCEAIGGSIVNAIIELTNDNVIEKLGIIRKGLIEINKVMGKMREKCKPRTFWLELRPYLNGSENNKELPNGFTYEGIDTGGPLFLAGGSAAQSSLFATIDAAFSIEHSDKYFQKIKEYMPEKHKHFIVFVEAFAQIKKKVDMSNQAVFALFNECVDLLQRFRIFHYKFAQDYIIEMQKMDAAAMNQNATNQKAIGSGGTELEEFLQKSIKETHY